MKDKYAPEKSAAGLALFPSPRESPIPLFTTPQTRAALRFDYTAPKAILTVDDHKYFVHPVRRLGDQDMVLILTKRGKGYAGVVTKPDEMGEEEAIKYLHELKSLMCPENRVLPCDLEQRLRQLGGFGEGHSADIARRAGALGLRVINRSGS